MQVEAASWPAFLGAATLIGLRHGYDPDHLTVIDGLVRRNARRRPSVARVAGLLFSLGHGMVFSAALFAALAAARRWEPAFWVGTATTIFAAAVLLALAALNLASLCATPAGQPVRLVGWKASLLGRLPGTDRPRTIIGIGMIFALSPDGLAVAAALGLASAVQGGVACAAMAAGCFVAGMAMSTGINGYCVARMVLASDRRGALASRIMTAALALTSVAIAGSLIAELLSPRRTSGLSIEGAAGGTFVVVVIALAFVSSVLASIIAQARPVAPRPLHLRSPHAVC